MRQSLAVDWKCFDVGYGIASSLASHFLCGIDLFGDTTWWKEKWLMESTAPNGHTRVCFCSQGEEADMKMIVHVAIAHAVENDHTVSHDSNFHPFFLAPFSPLSWSLMEQTYLDLKEFWLS